MDLNGSIILSTDGDFFDGDSDDEVVSIDIRKSLYFSLFTCLFTLMKQGSYIATLIIMMTWSITYHSWLTFILLLWSCVVWMLPNSRQACLRSSPFFVAYAEALLVLQYIYGLNLRDSELPDKIESVNLEQIGLVKYYDLSYQPLAVKILYTIVFWVTLRQFIEEKRLEANRDISERVETYNVSYQPNCQHPALHHRLSVATSKGGLYVRRLGVIVKNLLVKYWICIVTCMLMVISLGGEKVVLYRIAYMFLCLFFILVFQFSYNLWRRMMYCFWLTVIVYSMLVLIFIYTYQFENFENYWTNYLGIPLQYQKDIGLEKYVDNPAILFLKLLIPTFFLIITIIQLHYFHKEFLLISGFDCRNKISDSSIKQTKLVMSPKVDATKVVIGETNETETEEYATVSAATSLPDTSFASTKRGNEWRGGDEDIKTLKRWFHLILERAVTISQGVSDLIWQFLEIHVIKIVLFSVLWLALHDVCAVHLLFVIFVTVALPFKALQTFLSHCCAVWAAVLLLTKMIYQLKFVDQYGWMVNCSDMNYVDQNTSVHPSLLTDIIDNRMWVGFRKTDDLLVYCKGYIGVILILTLQAVVKVHQKLHRYHRNEEEPLEKVMFPGVTRTKADVGLLECLKFLFNYAFYKFGIEVCFVTTVICIGVRLDVYAVISALWLCGLFLLRRKVMSLVWPFYVSYQCIVLPIQYLMCVGIPAGFCIEYPWSISSIFNEELREWLYLPDFQAPPDSYKILVDFFQLLFACCQLHVFSIENSSYAEENGGNNSEIWLLSDPKDLVNPIPDFVTYTKSYLDMIKVLVFFSSYWITLAVVFLAGTSRVSLFAMGYVIGCFFFLWNGNEFYLKPLKTLLRIWNCLLAYNVIVILLKSILEVISCVFLSSLYKNVCWLVQLLGIVCIKKLSIHSKSDTSNIVHQEGCTAPVDEAGLLWDGICFVFLLLQKRLFCSFYFQHLVVETEVQKLLASRGAILINENKIEEVRKQQVAEREIMEKIKKKMDKILSRANQQKARGEYKEPESHFQGTPQ
ncbi:piezo-type mechanosensitive ion channel component 2-like [Limulus polyphemus]|uniref:Piezo-type mechanosensitive ion channel component 2-like n=1 Tax=Limulus polyphemus TaxID=6850 RepID=A0ABM1T104_LIMPO|nr:piezo-type mechanosensitive ion channel component 2-like [Limulus polyphemus]